MIRKTIILTALAISTAVTARAQTDSIGLPATTVWTYDQCIEYARVHNIDVRQATLEHESTAIDIEAAKAKWFPSLNVATTQSYTNYPKPGTGGHVNNYNGSYGLNSNWTLYDGGSRTNEIKRAELLNRQSRLTIERQLNTLTTSILSTYLQILYAREAIGIAESSAATSKMQSERAEQLMNSGRISRVDYTQLLSQYHSDLYTIESARSNYASKCLEMKMLLQLGIDSDVELSDVAFTEEQVLAPMPDKAAVYLAAIEWLPAIKSTELSRDISDARIAIAQAGTRPNISLNGSVATNNGTHTGETFGNQLLHGLHEQIGVTLSYNIFDQKVTSSEIARAKIARLNADLDLEDILTSVQESIESAYIEGTTAQARYRSGKVKLQSAELTDELTNEQFRLGLVNTLDLITSHNDLLAARQELLQAKYLAILSAKILEFYRDGNVSLP